MLKSFEVFFLFHYCFVNLERLNSDEKNEKVVDWFRKYSRNFFCIKRISFLERTKTKIKWGGERERMKKLSKNKVKSVKKLMKKEVTKEIKNKQITSV